MTDPVDPIRPADPAYPTDPVDPVDPVRFLREFAVARAETVQDVAGGVVVRSADYPAAHDHNTLLVWRPARAHDVVAGADRVLGDLRHRRVEVDGAARTSDLAAALAAAGYQREDDVVMTSLRPPASDRPPPDGVVELDLDERIAVATAEWADDHPEWDPGVHAQLGQRIRTATTAAQCTFLAVRGPGARVVAHADLFVRGDVGQVEEVMTAATHRNRGHASRLLRSALQHATVTTMFLVADAGDWPMRLYDRLGFDVTAHRTVWTRLDGA